MSRRRTRIFFVAAGWALALVLAAGPAFAAPEQGAGGWWATLGALWEQVISAPSGLLADWWEKERPCLDPNGRPAITRGEESIRRHGGLGQPPVEPWSKAGACQDPYGLPTGAPGCPPPAAPGGEPGAPPQ